MHVLRGGKPDGWVWRGSGVLPGCSDPRLLQLATPKTHDSSHVAIEVHVRLTRFQSQQSVSWMTSIIGKMVAQYIFVGVAAAGIAFWYDFTSWKSAGTGSLFSWS